MRALITLPSLAVLLGLATPAGAFELSSPDVPAGGTVPDQQVFNGFGCAGANISPALAWKDAPDGTKSFAVTMYDPDAPTGSGWWHWVVFNIPADASGLPAGAGAAEGGGLPAGAVQSRTDFGAPGYGGPCPPEGDTPHRYIFTVFALGVDSLPLEADAPGAMVGFFLNASLVDKASFEATYRR